MESKKVLPTKISLVSLTQLLNSKFVIPGTKWETCICNQKSNNFHNYKLFIYS